MAFLPTKETGVNILHIPFLFIKNQFIRKQSWHVKLLMLTQARGNRGAGSGLAAAPSLQIFANVELLPMENNNEKKKVTKIKIYKPFQIPRICVNFYEKCFN